MGNIQYIIYLVATKLFAALPAGFRSFLLNASHTIESSTLTTKASSKDSPLGFEGPWTVSVETKPANEKEIVKSAVFAYNEAKKKQPGAATPYQPIGEHWNDNSLRNRLRPYDEAILKGDLEAMAGYLRNLFRNEAISGLWTSENAFETFCRLDGYRQAKRRSTMIEHYLAWRENLPLTDVKELDAPRVGNPWGFRFQGMLLYEPVFEYNFHAHYFSQLLLGIQSPVVLEIGGGFGGLAHHLLSCNPKIKYIGLDLPENIFIQHYYLSAIFPNAKILTYTGDCPPLGHQLLSQYDIVLLPNFELPRIEKEIADLIVNVRSLSEMSRDTIVEYYKQIDRIGRLYFFHENLFKGNRAAMHHRVPVTEFPQLDNFMLAMSAESRWPKYRGNSWLNCRENLCFHRRVVSQNE
jgi:hypothetical protein